MPDFGNPFAGLKLDRKLTKEELIRAMRFLVSAEYEAVQLYVQLAESIDDRLAEKVLRDVADEEKVHAGEFLEVLRTLTPDEQDFYDEGIQEVEDMKTKVASLDRTFVAKELTRIARLMSAGYSYDPENLTNLSNSTRRIWRDNFDAIVQGMENAATAIAEAKGGNVLDHEDAWNELLRLANKCDFLAGSLKIAAKGFRDIEKWLEGQSRSKGK